MNKMFTIIKNFFCRSMDKKITYLELKKILKTNNDIVIIDVRSNQEYMEGHLQNAINIPVYNLINKIKLIIKDKNTIIVLYCQTEKRSIKAKKILENIGYTNIYILKGGIDAI